MVAPQVGLPADAYLGREVQDPLEPRRVWMIHSFFTPAPGRMLGGLRARVVDLKGFTSFINQRDLEVLLGLGKPGDYCKWLGQKYTKPGEADWYGFCCDEVDLQDDLHTREIELRATFPILPGFLDAQFGITDTIGYAPAEMTRLLHLDRAYDVEEHLVLRCDVDFSTGSRPDSKVNTVSERWVRVGRDKVIWERY